MSGIQNEAQAYGKIPCSVGILTLNSEKTLRRCLESVKNFAEIIVCDGNSTDGTFAIAREYGCKIVKQYESDKPNLRCDADKANVRTKNMNAASFDWYVFLDSDDALSPEVVQEIKKIAESKNPEYQIYRMPMRIFIGGREIKHSSNYPMHQIRFFNRKTGAYFRNPVHERIVYDETKYKLGTLIGFYDIHWSAERAQNFWQTIANYISLDAETAKFKDFGDFVKWGILARLKTTAGIIIKSLKNYLFYGFRESMPIKIEAGRVIYNIMLIFLFTKKYFSAKTENRV